MRRALLFIGLFFMILGFFGYGYVYQADHRTAPNFSAYANLEFHTATDEEGHTDSATLTIIDDRFSDAKPRPIVDVVVDGKSWNLDARLRQTPPAYTWYKKGLYALKYSNKLFVNLPRGLFPEIRKADNVRLRIRYTDGWFVDLPLSPQTLQDWKSQL